MSVKKQRSNLAGPETGGERGRGFCAIGPAVSKLAALILAKRGGGILARLKVGWPLVVASPWTFSAWPAALGRDGALKLHTAPAAAVELQHHAPLLIERINLFFGRAVVSRLVFLQSGLPSNPAMDEWAVPRVSLGEAERLDRGLAWIADPALRASLARLGRAVADAGSRP